LSFGFHAAPPSGEWINDPNGLIFADERYHLFAQHSAAAPDFREIGWGHFTSADLLSWYWEGVALSPGVAGSAYSGSIIGAEGRWEAYFTRHNSEEGLQSQHRATSEDGQDWKEKPDPLGPSGRNMRDPFVFWSRPTRDWRMLVAEPCDWNDWRATPRSRLQIWRSPDRLTWQLAGVIGPWSPAGVLWEVPVLIDFGRIQALVTSFVDRRSDRSDCSVRYWLGAWNDAGFTPHADCAPEGLPLDLGPDFYAAIPNLEDGWPSPERVLIGWASNWRTARSFEWPGRVHGGPISLPRRLELDEGALRLRQVPLDGAERHLHWSDECAALTPFQLCIHRDSHELMIFATLASGHVAVERRGSDLLQWSALHADVLREAHGESRHFRLFADGPILELFIEPDGLVVTAALPGDGPLRVELAGMLQP
jgi:sucrose-6-phosphate hydrolase SacC (GH32 family)